MLIDSNNWIIKFKKSKALTVKLAGAIALSSTVGTGAYIGLKDTVTLDVDGVKEVISTHANTVGDLLAEQGIEISNEDIILPATNTTIKDDLKVKIVFAKNVQLTVDGVSKLIASPAKDVKTLLDSQGITVSTYDEITPSLDTSIHDGMQITLDKAFQVPMTIGGVKKNVWTTTMTVADFLSSQGVAVHTLDKVTPALDQVIKQGQSVQVVRVQQSNTVVEKTIPFKQVTKNDNTLLKGQKKVLVTGKEGKKKETYKVTKENGKETARTLVKTEVITEAVNQVVAVGTKTPSKASVEPSSGKEFIVEATAYTPWDGSSSGLTATGINVGANPSMKLIAVDPRVIPLGSKVWVEGYGIAIAGDTGGAIKGHKIDVLVPDTSTAYKWGRKRVRVKIL